jgi:hypothetical protein
LKKIKSSSKIWNDVTYPKGYEPSRVKIKRFLWGVIFIGIFASMFLGIVFLQIGGDIASGRLSLSYLGNIYLWVMVSGIVLTLVLLRVAIFRKVVKRWG